jgi:predicted N-acetyltransferase YhbS
LLASQKFLDDQLGFFHSAPHLETIKNAQRNVHTTIGTARLRSGTVCHLAPVVDVHCSGVRCMIPIPTLARDRPEIETLLDQAFGGDRQGRTTYRLRERNTRIDSLGFVIRQDDGHLCGSIEFWPIKLQASKGVVTEAILLGPIAVAESCQGQGAGKALIRQGIAAAERAGHSVIILVGDLSYYYRFGFGNKMTQGWSLPGPVDQARVLVRCANAETALPIVAEIISGGQSLSPI